MMQAQSSVLSRLQSGVLGTHPVEGSLHGQLGWVASVHTGAEGLDEPLKHLLAQVAADELLHRLLALWSAACQQHVMQQLGVKTCAAGDCRIPL